tara:strand:- start:703 stop:1095 length:393 start_codon:yes stop_codon:yes gene_type:complete
MKVGFAISTFGINLLCLFLYITLISPLKVKTVVWSLPLSKGCSYPAKEVRFIKTELKRIIPVAQIHKCTYDSSKRLVRVRTYNFERGYQMKKPTEEVIYKWSNFRLIQFSVRRATHGNGEIDIEVYKLYN